MANKWYSADNKPLDIPTFQDLQNVTGQVFDDAGLYIGPAELPKQQLVIDNVTKRQYYAPKEYTENAIRYAQAKRNEYFKPEDWYGMENIKPDYTLGEQVIGGAAALGKSVTGLLAQLPTKIVYTGSVFANQLSKAIAQSNSTDIAKMKNGMLVEQENLYRMSMKNWEKTLHKYGLINEPEIQYMAGGKIGSMIGDVGGSLLAAAAVSCVGGLPAVAAVFGSNQFADVMEEGLAKGLSHDKAFSAAWKAALAEGGLEAAGFRLWRSAATVSKSFRNKMLAFAWEGAQESSQQTAESVITNYYGIREQTFMEIMADVLLSGLVGGVVGFAGASLSGQAEQRNIALRRDIGMTDRGQIVTPKAQEVKEAKPVTTTKEAEKALIDNEIAQAKKTGDNKLYNIVKYSANAHGITDEATIDKMYPVARKSIADGATLDDLTDILANQIVAYNNQLDNGQTNTKATQKAVEQIKLVTDPNRVDEWREIRKSELEKIGFTKEQAGTLTEHLSTITQRLSERLGFDITKKKEISFSPNLSERAGTRGQIELGKTVAKVALNKNADPTTVEHEFFHYIDRVVLDAAKEGNVEAQKLVNKRDEIIKNAKAELKKQGIKDIPIDEEILASAYEKWLWQGGKSEDAYEQKLFNAIREFFREVYDTVKGLMGIRITPEADAYFRAMTGEGRISYQSATDTLFQEGIKYDKNGKADTNSPEFKKWSNNATLVKADDANYYNFETGKSVVVEAFHGTNSEFSEFDPRKIGKNYLQSEYGFYFTDRENNYGKINMPVYLRFNNPLVVNVDDYSIEFFDENRSDIVREAWRGEHDGIIVKSGKKADKPLFFVFEPTQIKSVYNRGTFDTESPNIYYQSDKDLFATHNMNLAGAKQALKLGGLAMPSMAIRRTSTENTQDFGDISFVANERLATPKRGIEVYDRDAWTPSIYRNIKYELGKNTKELINTVIKKTGQENERGTYMYNIQENINDITRNRYAYELFLKDTKNPPAPMMAFYKDPLFVSWYEDKIVNDAMPYLETLNADNTDFVRRKLTLNNIMRELRRQESAAGGYIGDSVYSVRSLIKAFPQKFRNLKDVKSKKENLKTNEEISAKFDELDEDFEKLAKELRTEGKEKDYGADRTAVGIAIANSGNIKTQKYFLEQAGLPSDESALSKIEKFVERLKKETPTDYFVVKPRRVVDFGEFSGVIMPNTKEYDSLAEQLKTGYGLPVMRIEKGNIAQYKEALNTIQNMYPTTFFQTTQEELFRNDQATKEGNKVLDKSPTNEQVEKELATIRSGRVVEAEPKRGFGLAESIGDFVLTVRQRVGTIDKRLKYAFDKLDFNEKMYESKYGKNVVGYIKKYRKLDDTKKRELDYLILNKQDERIREFVRQNDMLEEYNQARTLLDNLYVEGNKAGMDMGFLQEYFPTKVVDPEGLITYLKGTDKWTEIERALAEIDPNNQMSIEDRANAINNILRGYNRADPISKQGFQNERLIFHKTPEMMKFYATSDEALMRYVSGMSSALAIRNAFNVKNAFNAEESIGGVVQELIKSGQITYKEEAFIRKMLKARLNYARTAPMVALLKNFGYLGTMNNITSAVTQIGDLYANFYKYNFGTAMKALFGKREITKEDLHIDSIWEEFADSGWTGIAVNKLFSAIGLNKMDAFGKNTSINGAWIDLKERLKNNDVSLLEDLSAAFGSRSKQVMEDIKNNNITEDVKLMIWTQLADTQPLGKSGVPVGYLNNPHGRIIYQLKTYTINQLSLFYADGIYKINKGLATKNKKLFLQGIGNTAKLALLLTIFNASADALKNLIMGRKIDISDTLLSNMLWNIGVSKYTFYRGQRDGYARALLENYLLPPQISMGDDAYMDIKKIATGKRKPSDTIAVTYVPFGRMWYWWFGGGRTQEKKKGNKPFEVEL